MEFKLFAFTLVLSSILHYTIQRVFIYFKKFDDFNHRSSHKTLATRTGGIGIFLTILTTSIFFYFQNIEILDYSLFIPLSIMFIVGVYDDFYNADFKLKFFLQIIVAKILIDQGYIIDNYYGLFGIREIPWLIAQLTTIFVFLVVVNAINFIDGIDGLAISQIIKSIVLFEVYSNKLSEISILGFLFISSMLPLFYFNFKKKRKIFLGDSGSLLLGTLVMIFILFVLNDKFIFKDDLKLNKTLFSILMVLYPLIDLLRVFILRLYKGLSPFIADQKHIHHKAMIIFHGNHFKSLISIIVIEIIVVLLITKLLIN